MINRFPIESRLSLRDHRMYILKILKEQVNAGQVNEKVIACLPILLKGLEECEEKEEWWIDGWSVIEQIILPSPHVGND